VSYWRPSMAGSPRGSTPPTSRRPMPCWRNWRSKRGACFLSAPLSLAWRFGPGNEGYSSCVGCGVSTGLRADARNLAKSAVTGAEWLQGQDTMQKIRDFLGACVRDSTTHYAESGIRGQTPPEIGDVDGDECGPSYDPE